MGWYGLEFCGCSTALKTLWWGVGAVGLEREREHCSYMYLDTFSKRMELVTQGCEK